MEPAEARRRFLTASVARLATAGADGRPHIVPVTFAVVTQNASETLYSAVDHKAKRTTSLRRLANVEANPAVALLADHYEQDWGALWWARADGRARVLRAGSVEARQGVAALVARYPQYRSQPPTGPVLAVDVLSWSGWSAQGT